MDGLLVLDKPVGPTSHDVVARMRRVLRERRIGHTGTLDPLASGVLPLVVGRATRLARFLSASDKTYHAEIRLGFATDTCDAEGSALGSPYAGALPTIDAVEAALEGFRGQFVQQPPVFSAKKVGGRRSHEAARAAQRQLRSRALAAPPAPPALPAPPAVPALPAPVSITVTHLAVTSMNGDRVTLQLTCSAGFYVRALARDLGERLGTGGHLVALRRTRAGGLTLDRAIRLEAAERDPAVAAAALVPMSLMLTEMPALTLSPDLVRRTRQGQDIAGFEGSAAGFVRLVDQSGNLVAIAGPSPGRPWLLHPSIVLR